MTSSDDSLYATFGDEGWLAECPNCGSQCCFTTKAMAKRMVDRGKCKNCQHIPEGSSVYKNDDGKWCSTCPSCGCEQAYTRLDHARQSENADIHCKKCAGESKSVSNRDKDAGISRLFIRYEKNALKRGIPFNLTYEEFCESYTGTCSLTGWEISTDYGKETASLDRIDNSKGYEASNVQWVYSMVNMAKNRYTQEQFVSMCCAVAEKATSE